MSNTPDLGRVEVLMILAGITSQLSGIGPDAPVLADWVAASKPRLSKQSLARAKTHFGEILDLLENLGNFLRYPTMPTLRIDNFAGNDYAYIGYLYTAATRLRCLSIFTSSRER